jgi:hypothetical protein
VNKQELLRLAGRVDAFCDRLNAGLAAVAIALAILVAGVAMAQMPQLLAPVAGAEDPTDAVPPAF